MTNAPDPNLPRGVSAFLFEAAARRRRAEEGVVTRLAAAGLTEVILPVLDYADPYRGVTAEGTSGFTASSTGRGRRCRSGPTSRPWRRASWRRGSPRTPAPSRSSTAATSSATSRRASAGRGSSRRFGAERYGDPSFAADEAMLASRSPASPTSRRRAST